VKSQRILKEILVNGVPGNPEDAPLISKKGEKDVENQNNETMKWY